MNQIATKARTYILPDGSAVHVRVGQKVLCTPNRGAGEPFIAHVTRLGINSVPGPHEFFVETDRGWNVSPEEIDNTNPERCTSEFL